MIRFLTITLFVFKLYPCYAQKETSHWFFDLGIHYDFSNGIKFSKDGQIFRNEFGGAFSNSSISDKNGDLLFYTNSVMVFNAKHKIMKGGEKIKGTLCNENVNSIIIPVDESGYQYYIITTSKNYFCNTLETVDDTAMYYHIVDMRLENGLGKVVSKNNKINNVYHPSLTAVKHRNGYDSWLVASESNSNNYYAYLFTSCGIIKTVVNRVNGYVDGTNTRKTLISPDGKLIGMAKRDTTDLSYPIGENYFYLDKFNDSTGLITPWLKLRKGNALGFYNFAFSPDSRYLYYQIATLPPIQYDLSSGDSATIMQSALQLDDTKNSGYVAFQNMPNGRLMITRERTNYPYNGIFEQPNQKYPDCNFKEDGIFVPKDSIYRGSYPTYFMSSFFRPDYKTPEPFNLTPRIEIKKLACAYDSVNIKGTSADSRIDSLIWTITNINNDTVAQYKGKEWKTMLPVGNYTATLTAWRSCVNASTKTEFILEDKPIALINGKSQDTVYHCANSPLKLKANDGDYHFLWTEGRNESEIIVSEIGSYTLQSSNTCGTSIAKVEVQEDKRIVPNVITPNGDSVNDTWNISNKSRQPISVKILNRWGSEVFSSPNYENNFGTNIGSGIYFYLITQEGGCQEKGWLEVIGR